MVKHYRGHQQTVLTAWETRNRVSTEHSLTFRVRAMLS